MPSLGADMDAGTLLEWHVEPGDEVERGDVVALVDTDKAAIDVEIFESGVIDRLLVAEGARVPVGTVLATLRSPAEPEAPRVPEPEAPAARQRARQLGLDLASLHATGPGDTVVLADVERAAAARAPRPEAPAPAAAPGPRPSAAEERPASAEAARQLT